ncbi:hypothetical protein EDB81DRAFT_898394 [Dactylonectria macrodidyma]|uniref:C2H2-type domain-containing protein n=1 Tax=Dactylonectria macrodidyma TaxID=307937 RepID=A0A9P9JNL1_9HYPO|nr:hypothetical protein EDB81DRAFT_898394 [Dactylonectria macrodidyma]
MNSQFNSAFRQGAANPSLLEEGDSGAEQSSWYYMQGPSYPQSSHEWSASAGSDFGNFQRDNVAIDPSLLHQVNGGLRSNYQDPVFPDQFSEQAVFEYPGDVAGQQSNLAMSTSTQGYQASSFGTTGPSEERKEKKRRLRCNRKGCKYKAPNPDEYDKHRQMHRKCPKEDCDWEGARDEKEKTRHVWTSHKRWAEDTKYPPMGLSCDICGKEYSRKDYVARHKREEHENMKRNRKDGG